MFYNVPYPNLELLAYKAEVLFSQNETLMAKIKQAKGFDMEVIGVFPQVWGSTALGFGGIGGQALTKAYTTVVHENFTDAYVVFFGNRAAYMVDDAKEAFFEDLRKRDMASVAEAQKKY